MKNLLSIFLFVLLYSCSSISLEDDPIVQKHFSESDIAYLASVLTFFDNEVLKQAYNSENLHHSYRMLFDEIRDSLEAKNSIMPFLEIDGVKLEKLISDIPDSLRQTIWFSDSSYKSYTDDSIFLRDLNPNGKYASFLKSCSTKNDYLFEYYDNLQQASGISPNMNAKMLLFPAKLDIKKERERLIYAIHFITLRRSSTH